jgi:FAD/FMN-containing dehydrogenase
MAKQTKNKIIYEENISGLKSKITSYIIPESIEEAQELIRNNSKISIRGGGTSFVGGCVAKNSLLIDTSKLDKIIDINAGKKTAKVEAGLVLADLNKKIEDYQLEFPIETLFPGIETIGGMLAKNSSGSREIKYSRMMNWVDSLEIINANGDLIRVPKSEMSDFVGMEGTTGLIVRATLRLTNKKIRTLSILKSEKLEEIFKANSKLRLNQYICAIDFIDKDISVLLGLEKKYHLFVEYETDEGLFKVKDYFKFMRLKAQAYKKIAGEGYYLIESIKVFQDSIEDFIIHLEENNIPFFAHLSSGVFYLGFIKEQKEKRLETLRFVRKLNGRGSYNSGFGIINKEFIEKGDLDLIKRVKKRQDPDFKFNEGLLVEDINLENHPRQKQHEEIEIQESNKNKEGQINEDVQGLIEADSLEEQERQEQIIETVNIFNQKPKTELSDEEKEKVKKLASGFFGGNREKQEE